MAAPNIIGITTMTGKTAVMAVTTTATAITTNSAGSGKVFKVNALYVSNVNGVDADEVSVDIYRSSTAYHIVKTIIVPADSTLDLISKAIYLEEGDSLRLTAGTDLMIEAVCSYEEMS